MMFTTIFANVELSTQSRCATGFDSIELPDLVSIVPLICNDVAPR
jgi:hypothetical protein